MFWRKNLVVSTEFKILNSLAVPLQKNIHPMDMHKICSQKHFRILCNKKKEENLNDYKQNSHLNSMVHPSNGCLAL